MTPSVTAEGARLRQKKRYQGLCHTGRVSPHAGSAAAAATVAHPLSAGTSLGSDWLVSIISARAASQLWLVGWGRMERSLMNLDVVQQLAET